MLARSRFPYLLAALPICIVLGIWLSPLAFVPVPWPDDSAFYFVGRDFWKWPPRWVMLPQAPFEPSYRIFNFNTMPLYPLLIGLGRLVGIDGSFAIKFWPLSAFALTGSLFSVALYRAGLPAALAALASLALILNPALRWASVLVRPESLIGLAGLMIVLGLGLGFPAKLRERGLWDPVSFLLAVAAYTHFNAIHLLFPVICGLLGIHGWKRGLERIRDVGLRTALYLIPWFVTVTLRPTLFFQQMTMQWKRLSGTNEWLTSVALAVHGLFQDMGSPEHWPRILLVASYLIWVLLLGALAFLCLALFFRRRFLRSPIFPAAGWVVSSIWLWQNKPEVWFSYYVHLSASVFAGIVLLEAWKYRSNASVRWRNSSLATLLVLLLSLSGIFAYVDVTQAARLGQSESWNWTTHRNYIDCIDARLTEAERRMGNPKPFRVWAPTFPDITIELSRRHPDWELTRTNDFWERANLAVQHGREVEVVVVSETIGATERQISAPQSEHPEVRSAWMTWDAYFLNQLWKEPGWKPHRYLCQRGRWQAFIFER